MSMRQQYEGNEILVVAQRQQVRELEAALADLREQHRQQAVALGKVRGLWMGVCCMSGRRRLCTWLRPGRGTTCRGLLARRSARSGRARVGSGVLAWGSR